MVVWLCHARVGHRQGPYTEQPSPDTVGVFLFSFWLFGIAAARIARGLQQITARGLIRNNPHRTRWGFFFLAFGVAKVLDADDPQPVAEIC
jgi:hypothetical protein